MLKELNLNITTVTGHPQKPNDQGSIENSNKTIKQILGNCEEEDRQRGIEPNWTQYTGRIMAALKSHTQKGKNATSAYENIFGIPYDINPPCDHKALHECTTVRQQLNLIKSPCFDAMA